MNNKVILVGASVSLLIAVCFGALGAHGIKPLIVEDAFDSYLTAVRYQMYHGLAILALLALGNQLKLNFRWAIRLMFIGTFLFSGSIYLLSIKDLIGISSWSAFLGPITPLGGVGLIVGWILVIIKALKLTK